MVGLAIFLSVAALCAGTILGIAALSRRQFLKTAERAFVHVAQVRVRWAERADSEGDLERYRQYQPVLQVHGAEGASQSYASHAWRNSCPHRAGDVVPGYICRVTGRIETEELLRSGGGFRLICRLILAAALAGLAACALSPLWL